MDVGIDSDEWCIRRLAEIKSRGEKAQIRVVIQNGQIADCYIRRIDGSEEREPGQEVGAPR